MTVAELIKELSAIENKDTIVVTEDSELGFESVFIHSARTRDVPEPVDVFIDYNHPPTRQYIAPNTAFIIL